MKILVLHGPNLNMLGKREPGIYGSEGLESVNDMIRTKAKDAGVTVEIFQSNIEGELISKIHSGASYDGIILNPAGYGHTSIALMDAIKSIGTPVVEVHLSNVHAREEFRHHTYTSAAARGVIAGFGTDSYLLAVDALVSIAKKGQK
jgi:3-dehydroquinate dehydratase-2